jgi:cell division protein FtsW (lipid II flippase)
MSIEISGFSGWGLWLIVAVLSFNLACIPLWFLVNHLSRTHDFRIKRVFTFLSLVKDQRGKQTEDEALDKSLALITNQLQEAEGLGALWGRRAAVLAELGMYQLQHQYPDLCDAVNERLQKP